MGLISPGGENLLHLLELRQVISTYDGDLRDLLWWPQERQVPMRVARGPHGGLSGFHSRRCRGLRPCVESVPKPEDSSPVLTWILANFWSLPRGVSRRLEWGHARVLSFRAVAAVSLLPSRGSTDLTPLESPQGSQFSSRLRACTCTFLPSCRSSVALPFTWIKGSVAFPRGFPRSLSHRTVPRVTVV